jgi:hypothetical protein
MKMRTKLGKEYSTLVLHRAGMRGPRKAKEAVKRIDSLIGKAGDRSLEEAAHSIAQTAANGGADFDSEYRECLNRLKNKRAELKRK